MPEYSHDETCSPPDHITPNLRARASALVAAVHPITCASVVVTQPAAHPVISHQNTATMRLTVHPITSCPTCALTPVHPWLLCAQSLAHVVTTRPTRSLSLSQEPMCNPPDHIVSNLRARACASMAAVHPISCTGAVATRPTHSLSQIQDLTRAPPRVLARVCLSLTR